MRAQASDASMSMRRPERPWRGCSGDASVMAQGVAVDAAAIGRGLFAPDWRPGCRGAHGPVRLKLAGAGLLGAGTLAGIGGAALGSAWND